MSSVLIFSDRKIIEAIGERYAIDHRVSFSNGAFTCHASLREASKSKNYSAIHSSEKVVNSVDEVEEAFSSVTLSCEGAIDDIRDAARLDYSIDIG